MDVKTAAASAPVTPGLGVASPAVSVVPGALTELFMRLQTDGIHTHIPRDHPGRISTDP